MARKKAEAEKEIVELSQEEWPYELPEGWKWTRLGELNQFKSKNLTPQDYPDEIFELYSVPNFALDYPEIIKGAEIGSSKQIVEKNDVLLCKINPSINRVWQVFKYTDNRLIASGEWIVFRNEAINDTMIKWYFTSPSFRTLMMSNVSGVGGSLTRAKPKLVANYPIPLPPKEIQQKIVDNIEGLFAKLDKAQEKVEQVLADSENRRAAILHNAFSGKLTEKWREKNNISFDSWKNDKLKNLDIEIIDGDRGKNYPKKEEFSNMGHCVFLNAKNVTKNGFIFSDVQFINKEKDDLLRKGKLIRGDIVLTTRGTIGNIALYDDNVPYNNMRINSGMVIYRCGDSLYKPFIIEMYRSNYILAQINKMQTGSAQPQLPIKIMNELNLCIPSMPEQREIVCLLDKFLSVEDKVKATCQSTLEAIATMRKSILAKAFRGELV